ncbi:tetratricopeptide repeat protein 1-like [Plectropomus leopardus]|uniref:tetratricopeptide repeat protein 1-like n=1 Tax=Plectropomus leopardus TaxID=160734 RepID=UPI001C4D6EA6|nr:tetratricopeptide repeat protein 1-like [Plectropomus leopardus]XP_042355940.1 tetratricopeptide repeat protein 1-like [Plectropomus leopardus]
MSSRGAGRPREQEEEEQEDFYDCQENLEPPGPRAEEEESRLETDRLTDRRDVTERQGAGRQEETQNNRLQEEAQSDRMQEQVQSDRLQEEVQDDRLQEEVQDDRLEEEVQSDRLEEEVQDDRLEEDLEMKEERSQEVEFDEEYLREVEKELTEEEKESRRQESLTLKEKGNSQFKAGDWLEAERSYTEALVLCPVCYSRERAVLFSNRAAARLHQDRKDQAIFDCSTAIKLNPDYVRALLRRAELYEQTEKLDEALEDYKRVLDLDPAQPSARQACMRLPQQIQERNEKLKEEMLSKLKDLGNLVLRPFGLSTNNFQVNQDANTGSYSINFVQNPNNNR